MFKYAKRLLGPLAILTGSLVFPTIAAAQNNLVPEQLSKNADIIKIIRAIIQFILVVAFIIAFIMLLVGGIRWILAGGDEKAVAGARNTITAALIGLVIVLVAFAIIKLVETFFGVTIISGTFTIPTVEP
ncbi:hypothetical protein A2697_04935 [Candidatus Curtissbacteria bacterium RIFCSPHIGHO2_01_FULL_41_44]|uniref:Uncharacterized protein n=1 Tax=Candidatus Curtissbacteria bacterium RIFCSPLOWO2_01_FULL_42_50 TaxID=1797730 RepID=A0A1F5H681_9BACT|nr:MAG: hypothetical protein A3C33_00385 [Candidatus Curtissbacteria bacterium RIFCSPHIGHO2_02_FULL_42_58]OGD93989.1 MAG: hypothetical protein A2697_04935 [Candidatus Curtissbacteria bacterium RIFCSPHIGHO2_01_FULL_41_44]OGD97595.1 MAG: hypothetical protein A3E71_05240 [Candidatus Curtissbacteria bacterium RIFCSPHIGHO2_12_FULL_42_33]OGD99587.1 MAG: hypothetical protein A3B54_02445 [Candidatus Curtissbacteria bacterium RIFCSPLOWO2_01_FULL_42_50]OGE02567.1 MAG: hypothetical protein A3G16_03495 [Ca